MRTFKEIEQEFDGYLEEQFTPAGSAFLKLMKPVENVRNLLKEAYDVGYEDGRNGKLEGRFEFKS